MSDDHEFSLVSGRRGGKTRAYEDLKLAALVLGDEEVAIEFSDDGREVAFTTRPTEAP